MPKILFAKLDADSDMEEKKIRGKARADLIQESQNMQSQHHMTFEPCSIIFQQCNLNIVYLLGIFY